MTVFDNLLWIFVWYHSKHRRWRWSPRAPATTCACSFRKLQAQKAEESKSPLPIGSPREPLFSSVSIASIFFFSICTPFLAYRFANVHRNSFQSWYKGRSLILPRFAQSDYHLNPCIRLGTCSSWCTHTWYISKELRKYINIERRKKDEAIHLRKIETLPSRKSFRILKVHIRLWRAEVSTTKKLHL